MPATLQLRITDRMACVGNVLAQSVTTIQSTDAINLGLWNRVLFVVSVGAIGASATVTFTVTSSTTSGGSYTALTGVNIGNDTTGTHVWLVEVDTQAVYNALNLANGTDIFIKGNVTSTTAATPCAVVALAEGGHYLPPVSSTYGSHVQTPVVVLGG